jgi:hypothetical protein
MLSRRSECRKQLDEWPKGNSFFASASNLPINLTKEEIHLSHIVTIKTEVRDSAAVRAACQRRQLPLPVDGTHELFSGQATGLAVELPDWRYPVVCELTSGQLLYDNYEGRWGDQQHLDSFLQAYAVERARIEARKQGHTVTEQQLADGSVKLTINVGGAA